ncbi:Hopanoid biosynthesis-associated RND transporter HpnN [Azospirillaceae bacterium]
MRGAVTLKTRVAERAERVVDGCRRYAWTTALLGLILTGPLGWYAATRLGVNVNTDDLFSADIDWRKQEAAFDQAFPQNSGALVVVIDGETPDLADDAASALEKHLKERPQLFRAVRRPDAEPFLRQNGLLFLPTDEVRATTEQMIQAQPMLGALTADPSLRGLFGALNLFLEGVARGLAKPEALVSPLTAIADVIEATLDGRFKSLSWQTMMTGRKPSILETRRFILVQPVLDFTELAAGGDAANAIRDYARVLDLTPDRGVRVRLTGQVAIENEEFKTLEQGAEIQTIASFSSVVLLLFLALRSVRLIIPILITLMVGLIATGAFAAASVGTLNPISVAFAVMFIGIAVDFGIQFATRYREERHGIDDVAEALRRTARGVCRPLILAGVATAVGFFSFLPTDYTGVSQLGLIAGTGMLIALLLNITLLPALLTLFCPPGEPREIGYACLAPIDRFLLAHRWSIRFAALAVSVLGLVLLPSLRFDFNPMNLRDPHTESIATVHDLADNPDTSPFTISVLAPSVKDGEALADKLEKLPEVYRALGVHSFIPTQQEEKRALIEDAAMMLASTLDPGKQQPPPSVVAMRETLVISIDKLRAVSSSGVFGRLAGLLERLIHDTDAKMALASDALLSGFSARMDGLRMALSAQLVTLDSMPESFRRGWVTPDGRCRLEITPKADGRDNVEMARFAAAVRTLAPAATGAVVTVQESARTTTYAFLQAGVAAFVAILAMLVVTLRRLRDIALVFAPMILAALMTVISCVVFGPDINFANIIALPLLFGIGVAFNIYFVENWRAGIEGPLQSSTARAILFSAMTTGVAFGSLALSDHPGTASMGILLSLSLAFTLVSSLFVLPALLGPVEAASPP